MQRGKVLSDTERELVGKIFAFYDKDHSGALDATELGPFLKDIGVKISEDAIEQLIVEIDVDGDGTIDFQEFMKYWQSPPKDDDAEDDEGAGQTGPLMSDEEHAAAVEIINSKGHLGKKLTLYAHPVTTKGWGNCLRVLAKYGLVDLLKRLLQRRGNKDIDSTNSFNETGLIIACKYGQQSTAAALIQAGANIEHSAAGGTALIWACRGYSAANFKECEPGIVATVHYLISQHGANVNASFKGTTALHHACSRGSVPLVQVLLAGGANPNTKNRNGQTPRDLAANDKVAALFKAQGDGGDTAEGTETTEATDASTKSKTFPISQTQVVISGSVGGPDGAAERIAQALRQKGYRTWAGTDRTDAVVACAVSEAFVALVDEPWAASPSCQFESNVALRNKLTVTSPQLVPVVADTVHAVLAEKFPEAHGLVLDGEENLICLDSPDESASDRVVGKIIDRLEELKIQPAEEAFADPNAAPATVNSASAGGSGPLMSDEEHAAAVEIINSKGHLGKKLTLYAHPVTTKGWGNCLRVLAKYGLANLLTRLLARRGKKDINSTNSFNETGLIIACKYGQQSTAAVLIQAGANIEHRAAGGTALLWACRGYSPRNFKECEPGIVATAHYLISQHGANVNVSDRGMTPLHFACKHGSDALVQVLLVGGANVHATNGKGLKPGQLTKKQSIHAMLDAVDPAQAARDSAPDVVIGANPDTAELAARIRDGVIAKVGPHVKVVILVAGSATDASQAAAALALAPVYLPLLDNTWATTEACQAEFNLALNNNLSVLSPELVPVLSSPGTFGPAEIKQGFPMAHGVMCSTNAIFMQSGDDATESIDTIGSTIEAIGVGDAGKGTDDGPLGVTTFKEADVMISLNCGSMGATAEVIKAHLEAAGYSVWLCMDMRGGTEFRQEIVHAARTSKILLPLINDRWCKSGECMYEFKVALHARTQTGTPYILPVYSDPNDLPPDLVEELYPRVYKAIAGDRAIVYDGAHNPAGLAPLVLTRVQAALPKGSLTAKA